MGLHVELLGDDGTCVKQGVWKASQLEDYFHGDILGDSHVGISITTSESLKAVDGSSAINRRWKTTHLLFEMFLCPSAWISVLSPKILMKEKKCFGCRPVVASWCRRARLTWPCPVRNV